MPQKRKLHCQICGIPTFRDRCFAHRIVKGGRGLRRTAPDVRGDAWWVGLSREAFAEQIAKRVHDREQQTGTNYATPEYA